MTASTCWRTNLTTYPKPRISTQREEEVQSHPSIRSIWKSLRWFQTYCWGSQPVSHDFKCGHPLQSTGGINVQHGSIRKVRKKKKIHLCPLITLDTLLYGGVRWRGRVQRRPKLKGFRLRIMLHLKEWGCSLVESQGSCRKIWTMHRRGKWILMARLTDRPK